jgi:hypothetical protein
MNENSSAAWTFAHAAFLCPVRFALPGKSFQGPPDSRICFFQTLSPSRGISEIPLDAAVAIPIFKPGYIAKWPSCILPDIGRGKT